MLSINPEFKDLHNPEVFVNHLEELKKSLNSDFPYHVFPKAIQQIIEETHRCLKFPVDYISSSIIYACSVSIGVTHKAQIMNGWQESAVVYLAIVGYSGIVFTQNTKGEYVNTGIGVSCGVTQKDNQILPNNTCNTYKA